MMNIRKFIGVWYILLGLSSCACSTSNSNEEVIPQSYIAHAGGSIDGHTYTNSKEAVEHAISCGITFIELDLSLTSDSVLVCAHGWRHFNELTTGIKTDTTVLSFAEFKSRKINGKFTPISYQDVDSIWAANPHLILVTDRISDPEILIKYFGHMRDRVYVECFSREDYENIKHLQFARAMLSARPQVIPSRWKYCKRIIKGLLHFSIYRFDPAEANIFGYYDPIDENGGNPFAGLSGDFYAISTRPNRSEADKLFQLDKRIRLVYVNDISVTE